MSYNWSWIDIRPADLCHDVRRLDTAFWSSLLNRREELRKILPRRADKITGGDIFSMLYKWNPELKDADNTPDPALRAWLNRALKNPEVQSLRERTVGDRNIAASSAVKMYRELMRSQESQLKVVNQIKDNIDTLAALSEDENSPNTEKFKQFQEQMAQEFEGMSDEQLLGNVKQAAGNVSGDLDAAEEMAGIKGYSIDPNDYSERVLNHMLNEALIERVTKNDKVRQVVSIMGRMRPILEVAKSNSLKEQPTPVDLVFGNDLNNLVPTELALLADPDLEDLFYMKFFEGGLMQYEHRDRPAEGRGPFLCCLDVSGSMRGLPEQYGLALFSCMARLAIKDKREVGLIYFADNASRVYKVTDGESLLTALNATPRVGGGTRFDAALTKAKETIDTGAISQQSDVLFVTDGYSHISPHVLNDWIQWKKKLGVKMVGVNITGSWGSYQKIFDAVTSMGSRGDMSKLEWLNNVSGVLTS